MSKPAIAGRAGQHGRDPAVEHAVSQYRQLLTSSDDTDRRRLVQAVTGDAGRPGHDLDESFWGLAPTAIDVAAAQLQQVHERFVERHALMANSVSREDAAALLGVSAQAVTDQLQRGDLVGIKVGNRWFLPLWQFDPDSARGFLPAIGRVAAAFPGGVVSLSRWMSEPSPDLSGRTPLDALIAGEDDVVVTAARSLTATGW